MNLPEQVSKLCQGLPPDKQEEVLDAERLNIPLITTDYHEFDAIEQKGHF
jgi:hypothetical protein